MGDHPRPTALARLLPDGTRLSIARPALPAPVILTIPVYLPKHTSWLNQVELWFSILVRRLLKRASFTSTEELRARILAFIAYFNQHATPFRWTYRGRPLTV